MDCEDCSFKSKAETFLDDNIFPILLPAIKNTLNRAKQKKFFQRKNVKFSMHDYFMDEICKTGAGNPFFEHMVSNYQKTGVNDEYEWSEFDAAITIQSYLRGFWYRQNKLLRPLLQWQKDRREVNEGRLTMEVCTPVIINGEEMILKTQKKEAQ